MGVPLRVAFEDSRVSTEPLPAACVAIAHRAALRVLATMRPAERGARGGHVGGRQIGRAEMVEPVVMAGVLRRYTGALSHSSRTRSCSLSPFGPATRIHASGRVSGRLL